MIYVYKLPAKLSNGFCFGNSIGVSFENVDWFNSPSEISTLTNKFTHDDFRNFIAAKPYARGCVDRLLAIDTADHYTMLIRFDADGKVELESDDAR